MKPTSAPFVCPGYNPRSSDLVLTGHAESTFSAKGIVLASEAQVLAEPAMVQLDEQRSFVRGLLPCVRTRESAILKKKGGKLVSVGWRAMPQVVPGARTLRVVFTLPIAGHMAPLVSDFFFLSVGRTEIMFSLTTLYAVARDHAAAVSLLETGEVARLAGRAGA